MSSREIAAIEEFYLALSRNEIEGLRSFFDPEVLRVEFEGTPNGGTFRGLDNIMEHIRSGRATWAEGACTPESFFEAGDKIVVDVSVRVRLHGKEEWIEGRVGDAFAFRNGKATEFRSFETLDKAFAWAGIKDAK